MKSLSEMLLEKLKVTKHTTDTLSFTFSQLYDSIERFVNKNAPSETARKFGLEPVVNVFALDYFKDNPLIITDEDPIDSLIKPLKGCKIGTMSLNLKTPDHITCITTGRSITFKNSFIVDTSFDITEKTFSKIFDIDQLETLYEILNEGF